MTTTQSAATMRKSRFVNRTLLLLLAAGALIVATLFALGLYTVYRLHRAAEQELSKQNLKQLADALQKYDAEHGRLPDHAIVEQKSGEPLLSWRVSLLPFLGERELYNQIRLGEPWDSKHNRQFWHKMPSVYQLPGKPSDGTTYYQVFHGDSALFCKVQKHEKGWRGTKYKLNMIPDGSSNTLFAVEAAKPVNWMKPEDIPFNESKDGLSLAVLGKHRGDGITNVVMCYGNVYSVTEKVSPMTIQWAIMPSDGNVAHSSPSGCSN